MNTDINEEDGRVSILKLLKCKCPRCRKGNMFSYSNPYNLKKFMKMNDDCPVCKQVFDLEPGFYYGTGFVSYALTVAITVASFLAWWMLIGISVNDNRVFYWIIVNAVMLILLQPILMRLSRTIWLAFFIKYDSNWSKNKPRKPCSENKDMKDAW